MRKGSIKVRQARVTPRTIKIVGSLDKKIFPYDDRVEIEKDDHVWIAWHHDLPVGYCILSYAGYEDRGFLSRAGVSDDYRGLGLHRRFVRVRERKAGKLGWSRVISYVARDNPISANNLAKFGYKLYVPEGEWGTKHAYYFYKDL